MKTILNFSIVFSFLVLLVSCNGTKEETPEYKIIDKGNNTLYLDGVSLASADEVKNKLIEDGFQLMEHNEYHDEFWGLELGNDVISRLTYGLFDNLPEEEDFAKTAYVSFHYKNLKLYYISIVISGYGTLGRNLKIANTQEVMNRLSNIFPEYKLRKERLGTEMAENYHCFYEDINTQLIFTESGALYVLFDNMD